MRNTKAKTAAAYEAIPLFNLKNFVALSKYRELLVKYNDLLTEVIAQNQPPPPPKGLVKQLFN
jgi:hypothetical protein